MSGRGTLVLVVGPSGAGKDSLIEAARRAFPGDRGIRFPRRFVTRPRGAGGEDHVPVEPGRFADLAGAGAFALSWTAHGLDYGIPAEIAGMLERGDHVIVNVSRTKVAEARQRFAPALVVQVTAPPEILEARLAGRARASDGDLGARLARNAPEPDGADSVTLVNDASLAEAQERFVALLSDRLGLSHAKVA